MPRLFYLPLVEPGVLLSLKAAKRGGKARVHFPAPLCLRAAVPGKRVGRPADQAKRATTKLLAGSVSEPAKGSSFSWSTTRSGSVMQL